MAKQIKAQSAEEYKQQEFGSGQIARTTDYLQKDPASYYHELLKNSRYYRDEMWSKATIEGELPNLIQYITDSEKNGNPNFDRYLQYENMSDYETYMANLATASADNETKKPRIDEETGYNYGDYTDREWLEKILENTYQQYEFELEKQRKENATFWEHVWGGINTIGGAVIYSAAESVRGLLDLAAGGSEALMYGMQYITGKETQYDNIWQAFLAGVTENEAVGNFVTDTARGLLDIPMNYIRDTMYQYEYDHMWTVDIETGEYTTWGTFLHSATDFVGMLLPSIGAGKIGVKVTNVVAKSIPKITKKNFGKVLAEEGLRSVIAKAPENAMKYTGAKMARQAAFYLPIFTRYANETVNRIMTDTGCTFRDINAGEVIANAALKTVAEWSIEVLMTKFIRSTILDKMVGVDSVKATEKLSKNLADNLQNTASSEWRAFATVAGRNAADALKEGLEEVLQDLTTGLIDIAFGGGDDYNPYTKQGRENLTFQNLMLSFAMGALISSVVGSINDIKLVPMKNRIAAGVAVGVDAEGKPYKLGYFQALTYKEAMDKINSWQYTITDPNAKLEDKVNANLKLAITLDAIASIGKQYDVKDFLTAAQLLDTKYKKDKSGEKTVSLKTKMKDETKIKSKANKMLNEFYKSQAENTKKYLDNKAKEAAQKALEKEQAKLDKKGVDKVENIITKKIDPNDKNIDIPKEKLEILKKALDEIGVEMIIGVNGDVVIKSDKVLIASNELVKTGNVAELLKGIAYDQVVTVVMDSLSKEQQKMLRSFYEQIVGSQGSDEDIVTALLFDKKFYTKALLLCGEDTNNFKNEKAREKLLKILSTVDQIVVKKYLSKELANGRLSQQAFNTLMSKVRENLKTGLIIYCTQYVNIDFGTISKDVLSLELSKELDEIAKTNKNKIFTNRINDLKKAIKNSDYAKEIDTFIAEIEKYNDILPEDIVERAKLKIHSTNVDDRSEAIAVLELAARKEHYENAEKAVYLPYDIAEGTNAQYREDMDVTAKFFGDFTFNEIVADGINPNRMTQEAIDFVTQQGYDLSKREDRMKCIDEVLNKASNNKLTLGADGTLLRVLDKNEFLKDEYLGENGNNKLDTFITNATNSGKEIKIKDISRINNLPSPIGEIKLAKIDFSKTNENATYSQVSNSIYFFKTVNTETLMHELTHATQFITKTTSVSYTGANLDIFKGLDAKTLNDIDTYMQNEMSLIYDTLKILKSDLTTQGLIYYSVKGEIEARATATMPISDFGFTWKNEDNKTYLVSPDGKKQWEMKVNVNKAVGIVKSMEEKVINDRLAEQRFIQQEMKTMQKEAKKTGQNLTKEKKSTKTSETKISVGQISMFDEMNPSDLNLLDEDNKIPSRFVNQKYAKTKPALKPYIRKGQHILIDPKLQNFLSNLSEEDLGKLDKRLRDLIMRGKLTLEGLNSIYDFVATAKTMGDFTFKRIAKDIFGNEELAKLSFEQFKQLIKFSDLISSVALMIDPIHNKEIPQSLQKYVDADIFNKKMSYKQMLKIYKEIVELSKTDPAVKRLLGKVGTYWVRYAITDDGKRIEVNIEDYKKMMNIPLFLHYNGTLQGVNHARAAAAQANLWEKTSTEEGATEDTNQMRLGKKEDEDEQEDYEDEQEDENIITPTRIFKKAKEDYVDPVLSNIEELTFFVGDYFINHKINKMTKELGRELTVAEKKKIFNSYTKAIQNMSIEELQNNYYKILFAMMNKKKVAKNIDIKITPEGEKKIAQDGLYNGLLKLIREIGESETYYDKLPDEIKQYIVLNKGRTSSEYKYKLNTSEKTYKNAKKGTEVKKNVQSFRNLSTTELVKLTEITRQEYKKLQKTKNQSKKQLKQLQKRTEQLKKQKAIEEEKRLNAEKLLVEEKKKASMKDKLNESIEHRTTIKNHTFEISSPVEPNDLAKSLLDTQWSKTKTSEVQGVSVNQEQNIANAEDFFKYNRKVLTEDATRPENLLPAIDYFLKAKMMYDPNVSVEENNNNFRNFENIKTYFLGFVLQESAEDKIYSFLDNSTKNSIEQEMRKDLSIGMTKGAIWKRVREVVNPWEYWKNADIEIEGVALTKDEKDKLFTAAEKGDVDEMDKIMREITTRVIKEPSTKKSWFRKLIAYRQMAMLSSPLTWLRNLVSNFALKRLNKLADKIGGGIFKSHTKEGQIKLNGKVYTVKNGKIQVKGDVTKEVADFVNKNFIDNKFFDKIVGNISRYNLNDLNPSSKDFKDINKKEAIFAQMMLKSMYGQFYNEGLFKSKFMNDVHQKLMKNMSDTPWVREATMRYFGKILVAKGYKIDENTKLTDEIMNDFGCALGLGLSDYMHQDNIFTKIETYLSENSEIGYFAWKGIMPFAGAGFQWYKAFLRFSPLGLIDAIRKFTNLEKQVAKAEAAWGDPKKAMSQSIAPEFTEFIIRRQIGQGVLGTILMAVGVFLAALGFIRLEDDDYGTPKLHVGNFKVDVSSIFGSNSLLAGAAFVTAIQDEGWTLDSLREAFNRYAASTLDGFPLMSLIELDAYSSDNVGILARYGENLALSFIPNFISWWAGATYAGDIKKSNFLYKAFAKIPGLGNLWFIPKKVNIYTGESDSNFVKDWFVKGVVNRFLPYVSWDLASQTEVTTKGLGLNKQELKGKYTILDETFELSAKETQELNTYYGTWNAQDLEKFYSNNMKVKVKVNGKYVYMTYNQMTDEQRKKAVQNIMSDNADLCKIWAWTSKGNKYYASDDMYSKLASKGIKTNVYKGNQGFVKK